MKKSLLFSIICSLVISVMQPVMAQETVSQSSAIAQQEAKTSAMLSWWRSLRKPTLQDLQNLKSYVNSKYRCLRYGEACSRKERAVLGVLAALVTAAVAAGVYVVGKKAKEAIDRDFLLSYVKEKDIEGVRRAIKAGANVNQQNDAGETALMFAALKGHLEIVRELLKVPEIEVNKKNRDGNTALMFAAFKGHSEIVQELLKAPGIEVNQQNRWWGNTALMEAAFNGRTKVVQELLKAPEIEVNQQNKYGETALINAINSLSLNSRDIVKLLLDAGADWKIKNKAGKTAYDLATNEKIKKIFREMGKS